MKMLRLIVIAAVCTMLLIPVAGFASNIISNGPLLIAVSFGLAYVVFPAILLQVWPAPKGKKFKSMQDALWDGELLTVEYEARTVAEIEETEDEGLHFLVAIDSGQTLCLSGQYLYGPVERKVFPSERIRVFKNRATGLFYGIEPVGKPLDTWPVYDPFAVERAKADFTLQDGELYVQSIEEIVSTLGLQVAKQ
jgi:hypothetical protein